MNHILKKILVTAIFILCQQTTHAGVFKILSLPNLLKSKKIQSPIKYTKTIYPLSNSKIDQKINTIVDKLCLRLRVRKPEIMIFYAKKQKQEYNAFAGHLNKSKNSCIALGNLLVQRWEEGWMTDQEIEAILAHELSHIKCNHALKYGVLTWFLNGPLLIQKIIVPIPDPKALAKYAYSRKLEKEADLKAINAIDDPLDMFYGLIKLYCLNTKICCNKESFDCMCKQSEQELLSEKNSFLAPLIELLSTHPLTGKRIAYIKKHTKPN